MGYLFALLARSLSPMDAEQRPQAVGNGFEIPHGRIPFGKATESGASFSYVLMVSSLRGFHFIPRAHLLLNCVSSAPRLPLPLLLQLLLCFTAYRCVRV